MLLPKSHQRLLRLCFILCILPLLGLAKAAKTNNTDTLMRITLDKQLGWVTDQSQCGGSFYDDPFFYPKNILNSNKIDISSSEGLYAQRGTSVFEKRVTITQIGKQITGDRAYLYRDPNTGKLSAVEMIGDVHLREPNILILAKKAYYNFQTKAQRLENVAYRTTLINTQDKTPVSLAASAIKRKITELSAWGESKIVKSTESHRYQLMQASYSTCPPLHPSWQVKASRIVLDKNTGRGYATHARLLVKNVPVFYAPYINFPIDKRRQTGFLWPTEGLSKKWGPYILVPFYWNIAPNYDLTITPGILSKRGVQLTNAFRYLNERGASQLTYTFLPNDRAFAELRRKAETNPQSITPAAGQSQAVTNAELNRIINSSTTRQALFFTNSSRFNEHWSTQLNFNYMSDDYYMRDFGNIGNDITQNQLLQEASLFYKSQHIDFTGRFQGYQTLHPVEDPQVLNQYRRLPQLILNLDYPDQKGGLEYFSSIEATNFTILKNPGTDIILPSGKRFNVQPGVSLPLSWPGFYINPRLQYVATRYYLTQTASTQIPSAQMRNVPIFDVASGLTFTRNLQLFKHVYEQTLEPQFYYTYIPYRNQNNIPIFDTTVNTLTYDQLFNYNRFSGIDRIGDANQLSAGITTRLIDQNTGAEIGRLGVGQILYFAPRRVTFCNDNSCADNPSTPSNHWRVSPLSALLSFKVDPHWSVDTNTIWSTTNKKLANATLNIHYKRDEQRLINFSYGFVRSGDVFSGNVTTNAQNNVKITDISFAWPLTHDISMVGRWAHDWSVNRFQSLLYGLQYDTCCWAVRAVAGRSFIYLTSTQTQYNDQVFVQFALKGLGNIGSGNPTGLLSTISGYNTQFGQEF